MLCSDCGQEIKPVVAIDIDGTLGDYHGHFLRFAEEWLGVEHPNHHYDGHNPFSKWFCGWYGTDLKTYREIKLAYRQGGMKRSMPIHVGAQAICWVVQDAGAELWMTTTRPYLSLDNIVPDTVAWLERHDIQYDGMLFDEDKYQQLAKRVDPSRVVAVLDDLKEMCYAADNLFPGRAIQIKTNYNNVYQYPIASSLDAAADIVIARIREWKELHA